MEDEVVEAKQTQNTERVTAAAGADSTGALIDKWFAEKFHGSVVAQNTECYNHTHKAVQELKKLLAK